MTSFPNLFVYGTDECNLLLDCPLCARHEMDVMPYLTASQLLPIFQKSSLERIFILLWSSGRERERE